MPIKKEDCRRNRAVIVSVYVESLKRKRPSSNSNGDHLRRHHHGRHSIKQEVTPRKPGEAGEGYDRRAELLLYSQRLRESARPASDVDVAAETSPLEPKPASSKNQQPPENIVAVQAKPTLARTASSPTCPCFMQSFVTKSLTSQQAKKPKKKKKQQNGTTNNALKAVMKSLQMPKKTRGFISKLLFPLQKKR